MQIEPGVWYVSGIRHEIYVRAKNAAQALKIALESQEIQEWECPSVYQVCWQKNILSHTVPAVLEWKED